MGNAGSGKSTLARRLAARHGCRVLDLDTVAWEADAPTVLRDAARAGAEVADFCRNTRDWVVEGCYAALIRQTLQHQPILLFLDPGAEACVAHCRERPWEPHKFASREAQDAALPFLLDWVRAYDTRDDDMSRGAHEGLFAAYAGPKRRLAARRADGEWTS